MAMRVADRYEVSDDFMGATWRQEFKFIAIDEAHVVNNCLREVFPSYTAGGKKRSALSILINAVIGLPYVKFVVSGTRLEISWVIEVLGSNAAKKGGLPPQLMGCITTFDASGVQAAVNQGGYVGNVDSETLSRFCGRPQFATRLTEALIMGQDTGELEKQIIREFADRLERPAGSQTAYGEFRNAAAKWALRGEGGVSVNGALGLEIGVCALKRIVKDKTNTAAFVISEPLVVRAFGDKLEVDFEGLTNENPAEIGHRFEEYLALHAADLIEGSLLAASDVLEAAQDERFDGEWEIALPGGDARMGIQSKDGEEPRDIKTILECAGDVGPSIVFPGVNMGADVVIAARRKSDNRKLLVFVQATSTPEAKKNRRKEPEPRLEVYNDLVNVMKEALVLNIVIKFPARSTGKDRKPELVPALVAKSSASASTNDAKDTYLQVVFDASNVGEYLKPMAKGLERVKELKG
ncbi:hypothetical protein BASA81_001582 [Batrachochytrium salamandrivorans]|nr:hypothetical protein BASA81_001582 [Batrachochytrium salamandrivorans]